jgi:hypothetical protein
MSIGKQVKLNDQLLGILSRRIRSESDSTKAASLDAVRSEVIRMRTNASRISALFHPIKRMELEMAVASLLLGTVEPLRPTLSGADTELLAAIDEAEFRMHGGISITRDMREPKYCVHGFDDAVQRRDCWKAGNGLEMIYQRFCRVCLVRQRRGYPIPTINR